jgi:predicted metal-dependent peptidase
MQDRKVMILGTKYTIEYVDSTHQDIDGNAGFACYFEPLILINKECHKSLIKAALRHEIIHAFKYESGLKQQDTFDREQETDWIANQLVKIYEVYKELKIL